MKIVGILLGLVLLAVPLSVDGLTVSEVERKLSQAQSEEDVESVIQEIVESKEYREACQSLLEKINSLQPPQKTQAYLDKALPILQDWETLKCQYTKNIWGDPPTLYSNVECNRVIAEFDEWNNKFFDLQKDAEIMVVEVGQKEAEEWLNNSEVHYAKEQRRDKYNEFRQNCVPYVNDCKVMGDELRVLSLQYDHLEDESLERKLVLQDHNRIYERIGLMCSFQNQITSHYGDSLKYSLDSICGVGTMENDEGLCVPARTTMITEMQQKSGGGCLIATATFGSELAPQVQQLREIRDNQLLQTESGSAFMESFNQFYYSFSPGIADLERENPVFKEAVKLTITPLLTSLYLLNYVNMDSEVEVLGYGISLILLNIGMYILLPTFAILKVRRIL